MHGMILKLQHTEDARPRSTKTVTNDSEDSNVIMKNDAGLLKGIIIFHKLYYLKSVTQITGRTRSKSTKTVTNDIEDSEVDMKNVFKGTCILHKCIT